MPLQHLIYISMVAGAEPSLADLQGLLATSVRNNRRLGITGLLLYAHGGYMQVLEGEGDAVAEVFDGIRQDPRHRRVTVLLRGPVEQRSFGQWAMACRWVDNGEPAPDLPAELAPLFHDGLDFKRLHARPGVAMELLTYYARNNGLLLTVA
ncbi:BLUF domain-containing protein [Azohydromonas lata]|uniref:BLUF domain-containing protein n=1 Tax=Azohydromonas lata TaxID=45677 RepID=A0ABU5IJP3_9BURK|nr:BLUF domain-containing protein [Azohydromonas lata]MDZ5459111.1 BLUF domain-containing protein [Azohydromonas lata]